MSRTLTALLLCVLVLPVAASAAAAPTNDIGRIAYTSDRDGNDEIYSARLDGFGETNLTRNPAVDQSPAWSPDGSRIAFISDRDGRMDVWVMNWDGSDQHRVATGPAGTSDAEPAWSPDASKLAFASSRPAGAAWNVWVVDLGDGSLRQLTTGWGVSPSWSPDGARLTFDGGGVIHVINADGSDDHAITPPGLPPAGSPVWAPWGGNIVFGRYDDDWQTTNVRQLYMATPDGANVVPITSGPYYHDHPSFSPDWGLMLFQRQEGVLGAPELFYMRLSDTAVFPSVSGPGRNFVPSWGPTFVPTPPPPPPDSTPPTITINRPTSSGTDQIDVYTVGQIVLADYSCDDTGSGVRHCVGPVLSGDPIDTRFIGTFDFRVFAADQAGNPASLTAHYRVIYPFNGFAAPIANGGWTDLKVGDGVPLKFSLGANYGLDIVTGLRQVPLDCASGASIGVSSTLAGSLTYNATLDRYLEAVSSAKSWAGSCRSLTLSLADGTTHRADVRFTK